MEDGETLDKITIREKNKKVEKTSKVIITKETLAAGEVPDYLIVQKIKKDGRSSRLKSAIPSSSITPDIPREKKESQHSVLSSHSISVDG